MSDADIYFPAVNYFNISPRRYAAAARRRYSCRQRLRHGDAERLLPLLRDYDVFIFMFSRHAVL